MADIVPKEEAPQFVEIAGNRLTLLADGPARLEALIALIEGARSSLRLLY
jgi:cardiolipin synthase